MTAGGERKLGGCITGHVSWDSCKWRRRDMDARGRDPLLGMHSRVPAPHAPCYLPRAPLPDSGGQPVPASCHHHRRRLDIAFESTPCCRHVSLYASSIQVCRRASIRIQFPCPQPAAGSCSMHPLKTDASHLEDAAMQTAATAAHWPIGRPGKAHPRRVLYSVGGRCLMSMPLGHNVCSESACHPNEETALTRARVVMSLFARDPDVAASCRYAPAPRRRGDVGAAWLRSRPTDEVCRLSSGSPRSISRLQKT
jgi:hypothetical protein